MQRLGQVFTFIVLVWLAMIAGKIIFRVLDPYTRKVSVSLADTLQAV